MRRYRIVAGECTECEEGVVYRKGDNYCIKVDGKEICHPDYDELMRRADRVGKGEDVPENEVYADERARKAERTVREFLKYENIEKLADDLADFLDYTSRLNDLNDYLDEYDIEHIGAAVDALYDFAKAVGSEQ